MRRLIVLAAAALLVLALVPMASAATTSTTTKHVDGTVKVFEPTRTGVTARYWLARFEVRTSPDGATVYFGYMHLYGITPDNNAGAIHEFSVTKVDYSRSATRQRATLHMEECIITDQESFAGNCFASDYQVSDGSPDTFNPVGLTGTEAWSVYSGNISIGTTSGQNSQ
jgi:hypothetical protein